MEQRKAKRVHLFQRVQVNDGEQKLETFCLDISLRGILLVLPENVEWGEGQSLKVDLTTEDGGHIHMETTLVHLDEDFVGCDCEAMSPDSEATLRRVLETNLIVPSQMNRGLDELSAH